MATSWTNFGRDEKRTFSAPDGVLSTSLTSLWSYTPSLTVTTTPKFSADDSGVYTIFNASGLTYSGIMEKLSTLGVRVWRNGTWSSGGPETSDTHYPTITPDGGILMAADGIRKLSAANGTLVASVTYDIWGESIIDPAGNKIYMGNEYTNGDTPSTWGVSIFPQPLGLSYTLPWRALYYYTTRLYNTCPVGVNVQHIHSFVYANSNLYIGAKFKETCVNYAYDGNGNIIGYNTVDLGVAEFTTGIYVFDTATGTQQDYIPSNGYGPKVAVGTYLFSAEVALDNLSVSVNAYNLDTRALVWTATINEGVAADLNSINSTTQYSPYPVVVNGLVIIPTATKVTAYNQANGTVAWTYTQPAPHVSDYNLKVVGTLLAAAAQSGTLVVCQTDSIKLLDLTDGSLIWSGLPTGMTSYPANPVIVGDKLYLTELNFPSGSGKIYCMQSGTTPPPPVDTTAPTVSISAPTNGSTVTNTIAITATSSDDVGVVKLEFFVNNVLKGTVNYPPATASISFDTTTFVNGTYPVYCVATDAAGNFTASASIDIVINNTAPVLDTTAPVVTITQPTSSTLPTKGSFTIAGRATDASGISLINIKIDGVVIGSCSGTSTCSKSYPVKKLSTGSHTITITAKDPYGNSGSASMTVTK